MKKYIYWFVFLLLFFEVFLRFFFGFCDDVLLREDSDFEYIAKENQSRYRFRNNIYYNSFSMRSEEIDSNSITILGLGDSILNGGVLTDQDSLATSILSKKISNLYDKKVQFLNVSAGSWGPDNCYTYLKKYGNFNASSIFLFVSSHDAYDNMDFKKIIGINKSFPNKQYFSSIYEIVDRYLLPRLKRTKKKVTNNSLGINKKKKNSKFNSGFNAIYSYSKTNNIPLVIYLHAESEEVKKGSYNEQGKEIIKFASQNNIELLLDIKESSTLDFRDKIHFNESGQKKMAEIIFNYIK
ncbi:hypothetical protein [Polaribacter sp. AHE13PA]|uniref:hypothetical protein n=1 Tax=Polaribacter sp. AHE13PA TaxID=2745562 RepID=UPI001C4EFD29|nr:hypothetical protein [Polaribacter sp. AHE13PA]QXP66971.1 hypothetical protein H0I28_00225 [Polaribacter sp. AHE13PA]